MTRQERQGGDNLSYFWSLYGNYPRIQQGGHAPVVNIWKVVEGPSTSEGLATAERVGQGPWLHLLATAPHIPQLLSIDASYETCLPSTTAGSQNIAGIEQTPSMPPCYEAVWRGLVQEGNANGATGLAWKSHASAFQKALQRSHCPAVASLKLTRMLSGLADSPLLTGLSIPDRLGQKTQEAEVSAASGASSLVHVLYSNQSKASGAGDTGGCWHRKRPPCGPSTLCVWMDMTSEMLGGSMQVNSQILQAECCASSETLQAQVGQWFFHCKMPKVASHVKQDSQINQMSAKNAYQQGIAFCSYDSLPGKGNFNILQ